MFVYENTTVFTVDIHSYLNVLWIQQSYFTNFTKVDFKDLILGVQRQKCETNTYIFILNQTMIRSIS